VQPVELHYHVREEYAGLAYNVAPLLWESAQMGTLWQDHQAPLPTHEALLQHVCAHATSDMLIQRGKLMQLLDIKVVAQRMSDEAWQRFLHDAQANHARFIYPALALAKRYALAPVPPQVLDTLQSQCPAALGAWVERSTMADVSESNPRLRDGIGLELAALLADSPAEKGRMWARSLFPRRRNLTKRYPRLSDSVAWPLCYVILNIDRLYHVIRKATKRS